MLLTDEEVDNRLSSPLNLLNRLRKETSKSPLLPNKSSDKVGIQSIPAAIDDIIPNLDDKLTAASTSLAASRILHESLNELSGRLNEVQRPEKLAIIAMNMSKVVAELREDNKSGSTTNVVIYAPQTLKEEYFDSVVVNE